MIHCPDEPMFLGLIKHNVYLQDAHVPEPKEETAKFQVCHISEVFLCSNVLKYAAKTVLEKRMKYCILYLCH